MPFIIKARKKGIKVYLIDPIRTKTASFADRFFQIRPGTDGLLAIGVAKRIRELGRMDQDFIRNHSENYEEYERILDSYSMEEISQRCELGQDIISELAEAYSAGKPAFTLPGLGPQYWRLGSSNYRLIDALAAMSGNIGISGGGASVITKGSFSRFDFMLIPKEYQPILKRRELLFPDIARGIKETDNPPIKMAWITACDPVAAAPCSDRTKKALGSLDFVVVVDHFLNDTAECADLFLPATTYLEEDDYVSSVQYNWLNAIRQAVPPLGEAKSDQEIFKLLADRMGFGDKLCIDPDFWLGKLASLFQGKGITLEDLKKRPVRDPLAPTVPFEERKFNTSSGKYEFITSYDFSLEEGNQDLPLRLLATKSDKVLSCQAMEEDEAEVPEVRIHPETARQYGIEEGGIASLVSEYARVDVSVVFDASQRREIVYFPHAVWKDDGGGVNRLRGPIMTDYGNDSAFHETLVRLEK
jgi:anaerobic selenocysteine-containing dehydrogenase